MKRCFFCVLLFLFIFSAGLLCAQTDYQKWKSEQERKFSEFREDENKRFAAFLEDEWKRFQAFKGIVFDETPKLNEAPVFNTLSDAGIETGDAAVYKLDETDSPSVEPLAGQGGSDKFVFFGRELYWDKPDAPVFTGRTGNREISAYWLKLSGAGLDTLAVWLADVAKQLKLDGWGTGVLASTLAAEIFPGQAISRRLACWFLMVKNGYDVRVGYNSSDIFLLVPAQNMLFDTPFFTIRGKNYYIHEFTGKTALSGALYIYEETFDSSLHQLAFLPETQPELGNTILRRAYSFNFKGKKYSGELNFNKNLVEYYKTIPHTDSRMYFRTNLSGPLLDSLQTEFAPLITDMNEQDKVQFLLTFVQTAFDYRTDQQQFGYEKWMLPEEALYYRYIDCEDRSILFTAIVRNMLGLSAIGLDWPGHIAAAVHFSGSVAGTYVPFSGSRYIICDPTYINADVGMVMPDFAGTPVKIIPSD